MSLKNQDISLGQNNVTKHRNDWLNVHNELELNIVHDNNLNLQECSISNTYTPNTKICLKYHHLSQSQFQVRPQHWPQYQLQYRR